MSGSNGLGKTEALELIRTIQDGSAPAWHRFIDAYAGLIHTVVRRYLVFASADDRRDLFVHVLGKLHAGELKRYDGRARLSTWLFIFTRSRCLDWLRSVRGRRALPQWLRRLSPRDQRIFRLYYVDGLGCQTIREMLASEGLPTTIEELAETLERLDDRIDEGMRRRMACDLFARSVGFASGRLLDFLSRLRVEYETQAESMAPEFELMRRELVMAAEQVREFVARLPEIERRVIAMRYYEGRTARDAYRDLGLGNQREVYTIETRAIRRLRSMFPE